MEFKRKFHQMLTLIDSRLLAIAVITAAKFKRRMLTVE
jgi:hypothetical protein